GMNEHNNNDGQMEETMTDAKNPWNADLNDPYLGLKLASERLSIVRYVFLVQIEDGIASAAQRASLEYADAVLIGWPEVDAEDVVELDEEKLLSIVRYVFLVQIEDGIASAAQRASLEYADAVLIGWPEVDAEDVVELDEEKL
ncbi:hypothetical protein KHP57_22340, partial [Algiphilus sp. NNCM1]|nr:hypothetical protein [Algiphilus acroporae]